MRVRRQSLALRLRAQVVRRGLMPPEGLDEDPVLALCRLVRAIPYGPPSVRRAGEVVEAWRGTSAGKHALLLAALHELGVPARAFLRVHRVDPSAASRFGPEVAARVPAEGIVDIHAWLAVAWRGRLRAVDVTFPPSAADPAPRDLALPMSLACGLGEDVALGAQQELVGAADALAALRGDRMAREALLEAIAEALARHDQGVSPT